ncbi:uncharacterized protein LOC109861741 [Pseudomyrmex gracilis]|uniref:uncharacterized protein LOC109861741 n=1 Tax=Pseudomyrmex gracilis TaxID=219809 RepID=UPI0009959360|nr:uncharacterized protein LOC109861741 [Pseudomyrmex gracilis]
MSGGLRVPPPSVGRQRPKKKEGAAVMERVLSRAAVSLSIPAGSTLTYLEVLRQTARLNVEDVEMSGVRHRPSATGGLVFMVLRKVVTATRLADSLTTLFGENVWVARPQKFGELRVKRLVTSIFKEDVASLATDGVCLQEEVRAGDPRFTTADIGTVWAHLPLRAARCVINAG